MKKKISVFAACLLCLGGIVAGVSAAGVIQLVQCEIRPDFSVVVDGQERTFKNAQGEVVYPILYEGTTYLPIRAIGNLMGKTVYWYENEKRIELKDSTSTVTDADVIVNDQTGQQPENGEISLERAKEIALEKAGVDAEGVTFEKARLETDDGIRQYDIEFWKDGVEYSAEVRAADGQIISWDMDREYTQPPASSQTQGDIGEQKAREIALERAGLTESEVDFTRSSYELDDGIWVYDIEFRQGRVEYSAEVRASDGQIISWDVDRD